MALGKILVIDAEPESRKALKEELCVAGYSVDEALNCEDGVRRIIEVHPDLIILDCPTPDVGGKAACSALVRICAAPIVMLSSGNSETEKVEVLNAGADDYMTKPYSVEELLARIHAILRRLARGTMPSPRHLALGELKIDFDAREVRMGENAIHLTPKEFDLLAYLAAHAGQPVPHKKLLHAVWGAKYTDQLSYLRVFVNQIRRKIEPDAAKPRYLVTEPWFGYRFVMPD
jgi:two-component system, OmpR family, KDP operon response regulator KdpE